MAVLDFGKNRFTVTVSGTTVSNHAPLAPGAPMGKVGSLFTNPEVFNTPDFGPSNLTITLSGTSVSSGNPPVRTNFGMFGSGRLYTSTYVLPVSTWKSQAITIM